MTALLSLLLSKVNSLSYSKLWKAKTTAIGFIFSFVTVPTPALSMITRHDVHPHQYLVEETQYPSVFPLFISGQQKECVATLINSRWAITAAHCLLVLVEEGWIEKTVDGFRIKSFNVMIAGQQNQVIDAVWPEDLAVTIKWGREGEIKDFKVNDDPAYDIALLKLGNEITHVEPIALYEGSDEVGKTITLLGWGDYGTGDRGISRQQAFNDGLFRQATNQITEVKGNQLFFDFDSPESPDVLPLEGVNGPGDSGGPALVQSTPEIQIVGVSSGGYYPKGVKRNTREGRYGWREYYVRISAMREWIQQVMGTSTQ